MGIVRKLCIILFYVLPSLCNAELYEQDDSLLVACGSSSSEPELIALAKPGSSELLVAQLEQPPILADNLNLKNSTRAKKKICWQIPPEKLTIIDLEKQIHFDSLDTLYLSQAPHSGARPQVKLKISLYLSVIMAAWTFCTTNDPMTTLSVFFATFGASYFFSDWTVPVLSKLWIITPFYDEKYNTVIEQCNQKHIAVETFYAWKDHPASKMKPTMLKFDMDMDHVKATLQMKAISREDLLESGYCDLPDHIQAIILAVISVKDALNYNYPDHP